MPTTSTVEQELSQYPEAPVLTGLQRFIREFVVFCKYQGCTIVVLNMAGRSKLRQACEWLKFLGLRRQFANRFISI